jgi:alpha-beta hydrolase superfamily lysophospholipase
MPPHVLYLHGFASGVRTAKGTALGVRLAPRVASYAIPDLEGPSFRTMTMGGIIDRAQAAIATLPRDGRPLVLIGSSLGGYVAALIAQQPPRRLQAVLLIAPAFGFTGHWRDRLGESGIAAWRATGERAFYHHAREREEMLGIGFLDSCAELPELPAASPLPVAIVHGRQDATVPWQGSLAYAQQSDRCEAHLVKGDHRLGEARHEACIAWCALDLIERSGADRS